MAAIDDFISDCTQRMNKSVDATHEHFNGGRTGRASAALLDRIQIDYYGTLSPLEEHRDDHGAGCRRGCSPSSRSIPSIRSSRS